AETPEVVQLRAADAAATLDLDRLDDGPVERERTLDAHAEAHLADGEGFLDATGVLGDDDACEHLDTRTRALDDADVHLHGVAGAEVRKVVAERALVKILDQLVSHDSPRQCHRAPRSVSSSKWRATPLWQEP